MQRTTLFKALVMVIFVLPGIACSGSPTYTRAASTTAVGSAPEAADPPGGIMNRGEYEHSPSFPPG
jgi:hypothetical protein